MKVDFMIIGAQKCGTSSLYQLLKQHPGLSLSKVKEPNFWCSTENWQLELPKYHALFEQKEGVLYGEASPSNTLLPIVEYKQTNKTSGRFTPDKLPYKLRNIGIWNDLFEYNPNLKFIYIVRSPFERIVSNYKHFYQRGYTSNDLNEAVISERFLIDFTRYHTQIAPYIERFGRDQVLLLNFDELKNDQLKLMEKVTRFLAIEHLKPAINKPVHANKDTGSKPHFYFDRFPGFVARLFPFIAKRKSTESLSLSNQSKQVIAAMLKHEIRLLGDLMDEDLSEWLQF